VASRRFANPAAHVLAHTIVVEGPETDEEPRYVDQIAAHLGITVQYRRKGAAFYDPEWQQRDLVCPEPNFQQFSFNEAVQHYQTVAADARIVYWGEGPDNALTFEWRPHLRHLAARGRWLRVLMDARSYRRHHPRGLSWGTLRSAITRNTERVAKVRGWYPPWMRPRVEQAYDLRRRWIEAYSSGASAHPTRPQAYAGLTNHTFPNMCEHFAPGWHKTPLEFRHPYLDVRVLRFMLTVPVVPWCRNKLVMRKAAEALLPGECVWRPKAPVRGEPWRAAFEGQPEPAFLSRDQMSEYVDLDRVKLREQDGLWGFALAENVFAVDYWFSKRRACRTAHGAADGVRYAQL
jgi:asparagine synthase (glutamine-hydrolysing)